VDVVVEDDDTPNVVFVIFKFVIRNWSIRFLSWLLHGLSGYGWQGRGRPRSEVMKHKINMSDRYYYMHDWEQRNGEMAKEKERGIQLN